MQYFFYTSQFWANMMGRKKIYGTWKLYADMAITPCKILHYHFQVAEANVIHFIEFVLVFLDV